MIKKCCFALLLAAMFTIFPVILFASDANENRLHEIAHAGGVFDDFLGRLPLDGFVTNRMRLGDITGIANIVVFGRSTCGLTASYLRSTDAIISEYGLGSELNLLFFDIDRPASDILNRQQRDDWIHVKAFRGGGNLMWQALRAVGHGTRVTFAVVLYIDADGMPLVLTHRDSGSGVPNNPYRSLVTTEDNISRMLGRDISRPSASGQLPSSILEISGLRFTVWWPLGAHRTNGTAQRAPTRFYFYRDVLSRNNANASLIGVEWNGIRLADLATCQQASDLFNFIMDNQRVVWTSSDTSVLTIEVRQEGVHRGSAFFIPHRAGEATVTARETTTGFRESRTFIILD